MKRIWMCAALLAASLAIAAAFRQATLAPGFPLPVRLEESEGYRLIGKKVLAQRVLDSMESLAGWTTEGLDQANARPEVVAGVLHVQLRQAVKPVHEGKYSLEMRFPIRVEPAQPRKNGEAGLGEAHANRDFDGEDWSAYNRISYWLYVDAPGHPYIQVRTSLFNDGKPANPQPQISPVHFTNLRIGQWNHVVWEIPDLARNKVTRLQIAHEIRGKPMVAGSDEVSFFIDDLEIQKVEADYNQGWTVAPGRMAYSHSGYPTWGTKAAYASGLSAANFSVVRADSGKAVFQGRVAPLATPSAKFQVMDFTSLRTPGSYVLKAGELSTRPFRIAVSPWDGALWKTLSFFYAMRCGMKVPGIHDTCHMDFFSEHDGKRLVVNGGWHDAADLSQNKWNTAEAVYAMYRLAESLEKFGADAALQRQLMNEAEWGLDWLLKTDFRDGWRHVSSAHRFWSNNRAGDNDDVIVPARRDPNTAFLSAEAEAVAARVLKSRNPKKAAESLELAELTFRDTYRDITARRDGNLDMLSAAVTAAAELHAATKKQEYAGRAAELAKRVLDCQERRILPEFSKPIGGYFYADSSKRRLAQSGHFGIEHKPIVALARLAEVLPDHPDWSRWYAAVAIHSDYYLRPTFGLTAPYGHPVNSLMKATDAPATPLDRRSSGPWQPEEYLKIGGNWSVRPMPAGGDNATSLGSVKALSAASTLRRSAELADLAQRQFTWYAGMNPFGKSLLFGEGYDWSTLYSYTGDILGSLSVGIQSLDGKQPYWQTTNKWVYREIWMHPVYLWMWVLEDLNRPAAVATTAAQLKLTQRTAEGGKVEIAATVGAGAVKSVTLRSYNLRLEGPAEQRAGSAKGLTWTAVVEDPAQPWVVVAIPDTNLDQRVDITGISSKYPGR